MKIAGPFLNRARTKSPKKWYLSYFAPEKFKDGTLVLRGGKPVRKRHRPYYATKEDAQADKAALLAQFASSGVSTKGGILTREEVEDYDHAKTIVPEASLSDMARFWRMHHPLQQVLRVKEVGPVFLRSMLSRLGKTAGYEDLKSRIGIFEMTFGDRIPDTISRGEFLRWLEAKPRKDPLAKPPSPRTVLNLKQTVCRFFNWMRAQEPAYVTHNPAGGIARDQLPKILQKEIEFFSLAEAEAYLRACERYDPEFVAHEIVQLFAGIRADDEMDSFKGAWIKPAERALVVPAAAAKKEVREVLTTLEPVFWEWWAVYGRNDRLRPANWRHRWWRVRLLAQVKDRARADELARLSARALKRTPEAELVRGAWPWNARRRTFVTYHVAKHQSAERTALIIRHRGDTYTLHNSYLGLGVTEEQGRAFFEMKPCKIEDTIPPPAALRRLSGIVKIKVEAKAAQTAAA